jgi:CheY-like chemotaxis protein
VLGDATQLYQVLMNLCVNARDAMPGGGRLLIDAEDLVLDEQGARIQMDAKPGPYVLLSVSDTGTGIPPDIIDKIFDPFFTTKEPGKGTGLGLSTVLGIVKHHGGFVTVHSEAGNGTQFRVYLPANEEAETHAVAAAPPGIPVGHGELVLVVDDEAAVRDMSQAALEMHGYRVLTAKDGTEAVTLYAQHRAHISVVMTDMMMPGMDGAATIRALRQLDPEVRLIAVSGLVESDRGGYVPGAGSIPFLRKPYTTEVLLTTLHHVLKDAPRAAPEPLPRPAGKRAARPKASRRRPAG